MLALNNGTVLWFCSSKCKKNMLVLKRDPRKLKWTKKYVKGGIKVKYKVSSDKPRLDLSKSTLMGAL